MISPKIILTAALLSHCLSLALAEAVQNPGTSYLSYRYLTFNNHMDVSLIAVENMLDEVTQEAVE